MLNNPALQIIYTSKAVSSMEISHMSHTSIL